MAHSNQVREIVMSRKGIRLVPPYVGAGLVLMGSSRLAQEAREKTEAVIRAQEIERKRKALECKRSGLEAQMRILRMDMVAEELELERVTSRQKSREKQAEQEHDAADEIQIGDSEPKIDSARAKAAGDPN
jgi:circadian clock protein KaiC